MSLFLSVLSRPQFGERKESNVFGTLYHYDIIEEFTAVLQQAVCAPFIIPNFPTSRDAFLGLKESCLY